MGRLRAVEPDLDPLAPIRRHRRVRVRRIHGEERIRELTRIKSTAEQVVNSPINMMTFRQPKNALGNVKGMIKQLYGSGVVAKAGDLLRKPR